VILQKKTPIGDNDTLGNVYFERLFPMGVQAMLEAADLVVRNKHREIEQDESQASYEGWFREAEARIHWSNHVDFIHDLIRASDPAPGAWTTLNGVKLQLFDSRKELVAHLRRCQGEDRRGGRGEGRPPRDHRPRAAASTPARRSSATARSWPPRSSFLRAS
jgi:methionyl-tRNA formyltransferase